MSIKKLTVAAVAALGLSLGAYSASAGPLNEGAALSSATAPSTFTLVGHGGGGGGHGGGGGMGGMGGGGGMGFGGGHGMGFSSGMGHSFGGMGMSHGSGQFYSGRTAGRGVYGGQTAINGHRGYWRNGRFFPFYGVGLWDYGYGYGGGSCYWNCRSAGYSPGFCSANAYSFCY